MTRNARLLVAIASVLIASASRLPLWQVSLFAPQYPEGLGLLIRADAVVGSKENDLQNINGLNHYIGMKRIEPDTIPELRFMPALLVGLVVSGLATAMAGRRRILFAWSAVLGALLLAGLADYWKWGYDYGHDLDPNAIIRIPGMSYQPPLIGSKQLLNFTANSWPASGGWLLLAAALLTVIALVLTWKRGEAHGLARAPGGGRSGVAAAVLLLAVFTGCGSVRSEPIVLNEDACAYCRMTISDVRFGAEAVTTTGRLEKFDSIECLAGWARAAKAGSIRSLYVTDLQHPGTFVPAEQAGFLKEGFIQSPMGRSVVAFASLKAAEEQRTMLGGTVLTWAGVLAGAAVVRAGGS